MTAEPKTKERKPRTQKARPVRNGNGGNGNNTKKREELMREVVGELNALRASLDEMTEHYRLRTGAQISELQKAVEGDAALNTQKPPVLAVTQAMLELLREAKLKPRKGRAKDFVRMQDLLEDLVELVPAER